MIDGLDALNRNMTALAEAEPVLREMAAELFVRGERTMGISKRLAPVRNRKGGTLRASGVVLPPEFRDTEASVVMGYGGAADKYVLAAHENPRTGKTGGRSPSGKKYSSWSEVGQFKFLEEPFLAEEQGTLDAVAERTRRYFAERLA